MERAIQALTDSEQSIDEALPPHLSPIGWEHINLTGDVVGIMLTVGSTPMSPHPSIQVRAFYS
jgi:hypothetical protein